MAAEIGPLFCAVASNPESRQSEPGDGLRDDRLYHTQ